VLQFKWNGFQTALAALLFALGFMIWQFSADDRKRRK